MIKRLEPLTKIEVNNMATTDLVPGTLDFSRLVEERTEQFTGREWVVKSVSDWLTDERGARVFLLTGEPGSGKTAVAARIVQMHLGKIKVPSISSVRPDFLSYFHFCQAGFDSTLSPLTFVQSLSETLANRYPLYRSALEQQGSQQFVIKSNVTVRGSVAGTAQVIGTQIRIEIASGDARPMFDLMVRRPLSALCESNPGESIVILVDSLDEALSFNPDVNIAQLLRLVTDFPPQVRFLLTCRSNNDQIFDLVGSPTLDLIKDAPLGVDEVKAYAVSRLNSVPEPARTAAAERIADKSRGNFLYAYHVLNDLIQRGVGVSDADTGDLPDRLEDIYRRFLERELASSKTRWNDVYRPLMGAIAVARGEGLSKAQLIGITGLAEDTATDMLTNCEQYLVGGQDGGPYRIYHQSFRDFLLTDQRYTVFPTERQASIARYLEDKCGSNWSTCDDDYALRYTALHWAEAALTEDGAKRAARTQALIGLTQNRKYQRRFERKIGDIPALKDLLHRAVEVAAQNSQDDMLPWLIKAPRTYVGFHREYLQAESVVALAKQGQLEQAEARLRLFTDIDEDWQTAARLIIAWSGVEQNATAAEQLKSRIPNAAINTYPLPLLQERVIAALGHQATFRFTPQATTSLEVAQELVKRISGQAFDRELLLAVNPSLLVISQAGPQPEMIAEQGYAAALDSPILVGAALKYGMQGTLLLDEYIDAHAGYNYVEYRNRSLWFVLQAVLEHHPEQSWVKERLLRILVATLTGGGVDFCEMLPLTAQLLSDKASGRDAPRTLGDWCSVAFRKATELQSRQASDSWGNHKRRLTGMMEIYKLLFQDIASAEQLLNRIRTLPSGFAGFQAPAYLRLADALLACSMNIPGLREGIIEEALQSAHHIQDYHFCARMTARCNALKRWHALTLKGQELAQAINRLAAVPANAEFAADHFVHDVYQYRDDNSPGVLPVAVARQAETLEQLVEVFQRPAVEFRRLNPQFGLTQSLRDKELVRVPDPGFVPLLAVHFAARVLSDESLDGNRGALIRALVPVAAINPTALDTILSYLLIANPPDDPELLEDITKETGPVVLNDIAPSEAQIGPDAATPS